MIIYLEYKHRGFFRDSCFKNWNINNPINNINHFKSYILMKLKVKNLNNNEIINKRKLEHKNIVNIT